MRWEVAGGRWQVGQHLSLVLKIEAHDAPAIVRPSSGIIRTSSGDVRPLFSALR